MKSTSSASSGCPSENFKPCRSTIVYERPSGEIFQDLANAGSVCCLARLIWTRSACITPMTSRDRASAAIKGFKVFGSPRSDTTRRPPGLPTSPGSTSNSSFVICSCGKAIAGGPTNTKSDRSTVGQIQQHLRFAVTLFTLDSPDSRFYLVCRSSLLQQARQTQVS